jgi:hypothetical protein
MRAVLRGRRWLALLLLPVVAASGLFLTGCASTEDAENVSERPWNAPRNWEGGLPAGMMEGR